jgi:membrane protease subunit (stomatin/prohibitin family)
MALLDVVQWKTQPGEIVFRFPEGAVSLLAQLIVLENQEAILFREGKILGVYGPGRHTLRTLNIPIIEKAINLPFGGKSPFPAEIFYINKTEIPNLRWGTKNPIDLQDPIYNVAIPIRAYGSYSVQIKNTQTFLTTAIGTWNAYRVDVLEDTLRNQIIIPKLSDLITSTMEKKKITILKLAPYYNEIGEEAKRKIVIDFAKFGLELSRFAIESINIPAEDDSVKKLKKALAEKAEIDILGEERYKMKRVFDTMEKAASNDGSSTNLVGAGIGIGIGQQLSTLLTNLMSGISKEK